jgi:hypothetical protein
MEKERSIFQEIFDLVLRQGTGERGLARYFNNRKPRALMSLSPTSSISRFLPEGPGLRLPEQYKKEKKNTEGQKTYVMSVIPQERRYHVGHSHHCFHPGLNRRCHAT